MDSNHSLFVCNVLFQTVFNITLTLDIVNLVEQIVCPVTSMQSLHIVNSALMQSALEAQTKQEVTVFNVLNTAWDVETEASKNKKTTIHSSLLIMPN